MSPESILNGQRIAARAVIAAHPIPSPEVCDAEMAELNAQDFQARTLYRICTEDINRPGVECIMRNAGLDCTIIPARGLYRGTPEKSLIIECATLDANAVIIAARAIKILNRQNCVLVERCAIESRMY
jgi:hypothetical protein